MAKEFVISVLVWFVQWIERDSLNFSIRVCSLWTYSLKMAFSMMHQGALVLVREELVAILAICGCAHMYMYVCTNYM